MMLKKHGDLCYLVNLREGNPEEHTHLVDMAYLHGFGECMCKNHQCVRVGRIKRKEVEPWIKLEDGFWLPNPAATCIHQDFIFRVMGGTVFRHLAERANAIKHHSPEPSPNGQNRTARQERTQSGPAPGRGVHSAKAPR